MNELMEYREQDNHFICDGEIGFLMEEGQITIKSANIKRIRALFDLFRFMFRQNKPIQLARFFSRFVGTGDLSFQMLHFVDRLRKII